MEGVIAAAEPAAGATRLTVDLGSGTAAVLLVSPATEVTVQHADGTSAPGTIADLAIGARIAARHAGAEMRSLPPQYQATHVVILPR